MSQRLRRPGTKPLLVGLAATGLGVLLALALIVATAVAPDAGRVVFENPVILLLALVLLLGGTITTVVAAVLRARTR